MKLHNETLDIDYFLFDNSIKGELKKFVESHGPITTTGSKTRSYLNVAISFEIMVLSDDSKCFKIVLMEK